MDSKRRPKSSRWFIIGIILTALVVAGSACGQDVANGQATATVQAALAVTAAQNLDFGSVFQGVAKIQDETSDALSGIFNIVGEGSAGITIFLTLPQYMALADGSDRMTVAFGTTDAAVDTMNVTPSTVVAGDGWIDRDPNNLPAGLVVGQAGQTNVYLGGRVIPSVDQSAGAYTGDIICIVAYDGT